MSNIWWIILLFSLLSIPNSSADSHQSWVQDPACLRFRHYLSAVLCFHKSTKLFQRCFQMITFPLWTLSLWEASQCFCLGGEEWTCILQGKRNWIIRSKKVLKGEGGKKPWLVTLACDVRKITVRYHLAPEWPSSKKSTNNKCWRGCGEKRTLLNCWWEYKLVSHYGEQCGDSLKNWK